jgi:signal transduction histidine kinase
VGSSTAHQSRLSRLRRLLPRGDTLPDAVWEKRHRFLVALLAAHAVLLAAFGVAMGYSVVHSVLEGALIPASFAAAAVVIPASHRVRAGLVTVGLLSCSALLTHFSGGYIEAHFHFFIVVLIIGLYEDWVPFVLALGYVVLHHGVVGAIDPSSVYNHPSAQQHPWRWAAIHGVGISSAALLSLWAWKLNEQLREERRTASLARAAAVADETRGRIERDLHDGVQQHIVSLGLALRLVAEEVPSELAEVRAHVSDAAEELMDVLDEVQELSRGSHPAILVDGGLESALRALARRSAIPVELDMRSSRRLDEPVEVAAYFVVSEALANAVKHAQASTVHVALEAEHGVVHISIRDDGIGGAAPGRGSGLVGIEDRVNALGGKIQIASPSGAGTSVVVDIPCQQMDPDQSTTAPGRLAVESGRR